MLGGDVWIGMIWGSDLYQIQSDPAGKNIAYYIPEEGGVRGSDTAAIYSGAKHPIAAHLFLNHLLDAQVSASNTNFIGYMGPNEAAKEFIDAGDPGRSGGQPRQGDPRQARRAARPAERRRRGVPVALAGAQGRRLNATQRG